MEINTNGIFDHILIEYSQTPFNTTDQANDFFMKHGIGNTIYEMDKPFERFLYYEHFLKELMSSDYDKYMRMHKGIPFYFLAWLAFDLRNYEKALYYIDASISEDVKNAKGDPFSLPASNFLLLNPSVQVAKRTVEIVRLTLDEQLVRFKHVSGGLSISIENFISKFVLPLLKDPRNRTIISAFYVFLLEYGERNSELQMRSTEGGSIAPFIKHLFSGALIFESLLKSLFPVKDKRTPTETIGDIFQCSQYLAKYPANVKTSAKSIKAIIAGASANNIKSAFSTISRIRNTTGHNLVWDDTFADSRNYKILYEKEIDALLYIVFNSYINVM